MRRHGRKRSGGCSQRRLARDDGGEEVTDDEIMKLFQPLWADLRPEDEFYRKKPLLAHYTTIQTLEKILTNNELWFSNPLFMNDYEEVRFGVFEGNSLVM